MKKYKSRINADKFKVILQQFSPFTIEVTIGVKIKNKLKSDERNTSQE